MEYKDYYKLLGVDKNASEKDIKKAYRKLAREHHPDVNPGSKSAEQRFKEINEAYEVLGDKDKKAQYDQLGSYVQGGRIPEDIFRGRKAPGGGQRGYHFDLGDLGGVSGSAGLDGFSDFFNMFFGGQQTGRTQRTRSWDSTFGEEHTQKRTKHTHEIPVELSLEEAAYGASRILQVDKEITCERCGGAGFTGNATCTECHGSGRKLRPTRLEVKIPAGVKEGQKIRVEDHHLVVKFAPHPFFEVKNGELHCEIPVTVTEAVFGGEIDIPTLKGKASVTIPPETQSGKTLRLTGLGMPSIGRAAGNLYVKTRIVIPSAIGAREKKLFEELAKINRENPRAEILSRKWV